MTKIFIYCLVILISIICIGIIQVNAQDDDPYIWMYGLWDQNCIQTQCGYGLQHRQALCRHVQTVEDGVDGSLCEKSRGTKALTEMECFYTPLNAEKKCGGANGTIAYDCIYNTNFNPTDSKSNYQICQCKNGFTGDYCEIAPPPGPEPPEPKPDPEPTKKWKLWQKVVVGIIFFVIIVVLIFAILFFLRKVRQRKSKNSTSVNDSTSNDGKYVNMTEETIYA